MKDYPSQKNNLGGTALKHRTIVSCLALLAVGAGLIACSTTPDSIAAGTDTSPYGNLTVGEKFGAAVGQPSADAQRVLLAQGYGFEGIVRCGSDTKILLGCQQQEQFLAFQPIQNGRKGHIYLRIENDRVAQIGWMIHTVATLDG